MNLFRLKINLKTQEGMGLSSGGLKQRNLKKKIRV